MTKRDLEKVVSEVTCNSREAVEIVDKIIEFIQQGLLEDGKVQLGGLGSFKIKVRKARKGIHPRTGKSLMIGPKRIIKFNPGKKLLERLKKEEANV